jgi:hypothetical protein
MECKKHDTRDDTRTAAEKLFNSPELLAQIFSHLEKGALARASGVSTLWHIECARHLWLACNNLQHLENSVRLHNQEKIARLVRHLELDFMQQVWSAGDLPPLPNLRSIFVSTDIVNNSTPITTHNADMTALTMAPWLLDILYQSCDNLRSVTLNLNLAYDAGENLKYLLHHATLDELHFGPLLHGAVDDWAVGQILTQKRLHVLEMHKPITPRLMNVLRRHSKDDLSLPNLTHLCIAFEIDNKNNDIMASFFHLTPNVETLDVTLRPRPEDSPWAPDSSVFSSISLLEHLQTLIIRIETVTGSDMNNEPVYTKVTGADLVALSRLPLRSLFVGPPCSGADVLELVQVTGADLTHILHCWEHLESLGLDMWCREVVCNRQQEEDIHKATSQLRVHCFRVNMLVLEEEDAVDPLVWLGENSNFCPDPMIWEPRSLYHSDHAQSDYKVEELIPAYSSSRTTH